MGRFISQTSVSLLLASLLGVSATAQQPTMPRFLLNGTQLGPATLPPTATFEVASLKRTTSTLQVPRWPMVSPGGRFQASNISLVELLTRAYDVREYQLRGITDAMRRDRYDIVANTGGTINDTDIRTMMRNLLTERLKLSLRIEQQDVPAQALVFARSDKKLGPNLKRLPAGSDCLKNRTAFPRDASTIAPTGEGRVGGSSCGPLLKVAQRFEDTLEMPVIDQTGLGGEWTALIFYADQRSTAPADPNLPSLATALSEQWGMKLQPTRAKLEVIVVVSVQEPEQK